MSDQLNTAADLLSEQARRYDIALYYTHGDEEKAKNMLAGTYKDISVLKVKFSSSSLYGAFLLFFNHVYSAVVHCYAIVTHSFAVEDVKTSVDWRVFEGEIENFINTVEHDHVIRSKFKDVISSYLTVNMGTGDQKANELGRALEIDDHVSVTSLLKKAIQDRLGLTNVHLIVDNQTISSIDMEIYSASSIKISEHQIEKMKQDKTEDPDIEPLPEEVEDELKGREVKLLMNGTLVLSPIKGKDIDLLAPGDRIKIRILDSNWKVEKVLKVFNAFDENGEHKPVTGRVISLKRKQTGGFKITTVVAKAIYAIIDEDEENLKVAFEPGLPSGREDVFGSKIRKHLVVALVIIILAFTVFLIAFLL